MVGRGYTPPIMITDDHKSVIKTPGVAASSSNTAMDEDDVPAPASSTAPDASQQLAPSSGPKRTAKRRLAASSSGIKEEEGSNEAENRNASSFKREAPSNTGTVRANKRRATRDVIQSYKDTSPSPVPLTPAPSRTPPASRHHSRKPSTQTLSASTTIMSSAGMRGFSPALSVGSSAYTPMQSQPQSTFTTAPSSPLITNVSSPLASGNGGNGVFLHYPVTSPLSEPSPSPLITHAGSVEVHSMSSMTAQMQNIQQQQQQPPSYPSQPFLQGNEQQMDALANALLSASVPEAVHQNEMQLRIPSPLSTMHTPSTMDTEALFSAFTPSYGVAASSLALTQTTTSAIAQVLINQPSSEPTPPPPPPPQIHRLIPASGPTHGGIEVTVLGANFMPSHRCVFGDTVAASTQMWSENTLVCVLPPAATPGPVVVGFEGIPLSMMGGMGGGIGMNGLPVGDGRTLPLFNYLDNSDRAL